MSPHTLRAYGDDLTRFIDFCAGSRGRRAERSTLAALKPARYYAPSSPVAATKGSVFAASAGRCPRFAASFVTSRAKKYCENPAAKAMRTPKLARTLPRPLTEKDAARDT